MPERTVNQHVALLQQRIDALQQRVAAAPAQAAAVLPKALEELRTALAALHVADKELRQQSEAAQRELLTRLVTAQEEERRRLSYELHDHLGQSVNGILLWLKALEAHCRAVDLQPLQTLAATLAQDVHDLAWVLRPPELDNKDIETVLGDYVAEWAQRTEITADFLSTGFPTQGLARHLEVTLYRLLQEALTNVLRHAQAQRVSVLLTCHGEVVQAVIEDHGRGFDVAAVLDGPPSRRLGLQGMRERATLVGGTVELESAPGAGTTVFVRLPLQPLDGTPPPSETAPRPPEALT